MARWRAPHHRGRVGRHLAGSPWDLGSQLAIAAALSCRDSRQEDKGHCASGARAGADSGTGTDLVSLTPTAAVHRTGKAGEEGKGQAAHGAGPPPQDEERAGSRSSDCQEVELHSCPPGHRMASSGDSDLGGSVCAGAPASTPHLELSSVGLAPPQGLQTRTPPVRPLLPTAAAPGIQATVILPDH